MIQKYKLKAVFLLTAEPNSEFPNFNSQLFLLLLLLSHFSRVRRCAPHRRQPTRLPRPWDSPGKNTGVGRHFLLQCKKVKSESRDPMDCSLPGSSIHEIFQARVLEWDAIAFSKKPDVGQRAPKCIFRNKGCGHGELCVLNGNKWSL